MDRSIERAFHRNLYFLLQQLRGRPVHRFLRRLQARERLPRAELEQLTRRELESSLHYAREKVPLYSTGRWDAALDASNETRLGAWPVLDRETVRTRTAELHARRWRPGRFQRQSSASTGPHLDVAWNPHAAAWGWANEYRSMLWHGVPPGSRTLLMSTSGQRIQDWIKNCRVFSTRELTPERVDEAARYLLEQQPGLCAGLPSALAMLARHVREHYPDAPETLVPVVKIGGEQVYDFQREELARYFGATVVEFYGCTEVGPIAAQCPAGSMHLVSDNAHVEILRADEPVEAGEFGDIAVTTLVNRAMPLIRCKVGDLGRLSPDPCRCGLPYPVLAELVGRAADVFVTTDGEAVHGTALGSKLRTLLADAPVGAIREVLFQQVEVHRWKIMVESGSAFDETVAARLEGLVRETFGADCGVELERVALMPREPSGKFRYYRAAEAGGPLEARQAATPREEPHLTGVRE